jgi:hypothetical protein
MGRGARQGQTRRDKARHGDAKHFVVVGKENFGGKRGKPLPLRCKRQSQPPYSLRRTVRNARNKVQSTGVETSSCTNKKSTNENTRIKTAL